MKKRLLSILILFFITTICQAQSLVLLGMTRYGGLKDSGTIFNFNISNSSETTIHNFNGTGGMPMGAFLQANNGSLYGMTEWGGNLGAGDGTIFSYNTSGSYNIIHDFGENGDGEIPLGTFIQANNNMLYGVDIMGGAYGDGTIFSYDIYSGIETTLHSFGNGTDGFDCYSTLIQATNGLLYGTAANGGMNVPINSLGDGIIFSYDINTDNYTVLYNFGATDTDGKVPGSSLIQAKNGLLYGLTTYGGAYDAGTIFSYDASTAIETDMHDFGSGNDGTTPLGSLIQATNGLLYGMTQEGGAKNAGVIFSFDTSGHYTVLHSFGNGTDERNPGNSLFQASNGILYGMTSAGGANYVGTIFSYDISKETETDLYDFSSGTGCSPEGYLIEYDATGINQLSVNSNQLSIYPNPTSGQFTIKANDNQNGYTVEIYNLIGEEIYQSVNKSSLGVIDLDSQPAGLYFVYLKSDEGVEVGKVLVTR